MTEAQSHAKGVLVRMPEFFFLGGHQKTLKIQDVCQDIFRFGSVNDFCFSL